ncbi:MAG: TetR/AcrR family transcriptional regulator [Microbacterium sp.]
MSTSPRGRLALAAVQQFGAQPFDEVTVSALAADAEVTTGAIYHHFGSKLGLYEFVRADVERRLLDRMEGAADAASEPTAGARSALLVGFDFAVREGFSRLLGTPPAGSEGDRLTDLLAAQHASPLLGRVIAAAWREALAAVADGADPAQARAALEAIAP